MELCCDFHKKVKHRLRKVAITLTALILEFAYLGVVRIFLEAHCAGDVIIVPDKKFWTTRKLMAFHVKPKTILEL